MALPTYSFADDLWQVAGAVVHAPRRAGASGRRGASLLRLHRVNASLSWTATLHVVFSSALQLFSDLCNPEIGRVVATTIPISAISITSCKLLNYGLHAFVTELKETFTVDFP